MEAEPNDALANATKVSGLSFCGELSSGTDVDFVQIMLPPDTTSLGGSINLFGAMPAVDLFLTVKGTRIELANGVSPPIEPGEPYTFEVRNKGTKKLQYRYEMTVMK
jgi:hypothetical protein